MKRKLLGILTGAFLLLICVGTASAAESHNVPGGEIRVSAAGAVSYCSAGATEAEIPAEVNGIAVTSIGKDAFKNRSKLTRVVIPDSVTVIGQDAFNGCSALEDVTIPAGAVLENGAFSWCTAVKNVRYVGAGEMADYAESYTWSPCYSGSYYNNHEVTVEIASGVTSIGAHAFHGCGKLVKAVVPDTVTKIGESSFESCSSLGALDFVQYADEIGSYAFKGCSGATGAVTVKDGVSAIAAEAFRGCSSLQTLTLPDSVTVIGQDAFNGCSALADATIPAGAVLENGAFSWCSGIKNVRYIGVGDMADYTESYTWSPCYSGCYYNDHEVTVTVEAGVTSIGPHAFHGCGSLIDAQIPDTVTKISASAFEGCVRLNNMEFVRYADEIGNYAFKGCGGATGGATIKDGVSAIAAEAFRGCSSLQTLTLPDSVTVIGQDAFNGCSALEHVTLPAGAAPENGAFSWCSNIKSVRYIGVGDMADYAESYTWSPCYAGSYYNNHDVEVEITSGVTSIGAHAFHGCGSLIDAQVPDTVTKIGASAFEGCVRLDDMEFVRYADEIGNYAFKGCSGATGGATIKDGVSAIAAEAFRGCSSLQTLTLPDSVTVIGQDAFNGCSALADATIPAGVVLENGAFSWCSGIQNVRYIGVGDMADYADTYTWSPCYAGSYYNDHDVTVTVEAGVTSIGAHAFHGCGKLVKANVADSVTKIGESAFEGCSSLRDLEFVQYADEIGNYAFKGCSSATGGATIKDGVSAIAAEAFRGCSSLQTLTLPDSVTVVGRDAFNGCSALTDATLPAAAALENGAFSWCSSINNVRYIGAGEMADYADTYTWSPCYAGSYYNDHDVTVTVEAGVTSIGAHAFHGCGKLVKANIADSVTKIGESAFEGCSGLLDLEFVRYADEIGAYAFKGCSGATGKAIVKDGVGEIPAEAFRGCSSLKTLVLPASLKSIRNDAFNGCSALEDVTFPASVDLANGAFSWCSKVNHVLFVGSGAMSDFSDKYSSSPWYAGCYYNDHDVTIDIAQGVTSIGKMALYGCGRVQNVTVPLSVTRIDDYAFYNCAALHVYYAGSEEQWGGVTATLLKHTLGNTNLFMHFNGAARLVVTASDGRSLLSQEFSVPDNAAVFFVGYDSAGKMSEIHSKAAGENLSFAVSDTRTAKVRIFALLENFALLRAPIDAAV